MQQLSKDTTVLQYIAMQPPAMKKALTQLRAVIRVAAPKAEEKISYQVPCYKLNGMLVGFAAFKEHCSFFVMSPAVMQQYGAVLEKYSVSKGTIRFAPDKPLPKTLVTKLVKARIAENNARAKARTAKKAAR